MIHDFTIWFSNFILNSIPSHFIRGFFYKKILKFTILNGSSIHLGCHVTCKSNLRIGLNTTINQFCWLDNRGGIQIGDNVSIGPRANLITAEHDIQASDCKGLTDKIIIKDYVFIGFGVTIMPGIIVGKGAVVASGAVLTKSIPDYEIWAGVPAKKIGDRNQHLNYSGTYMRKFH